MIVNEDGHWIDDPMIVVGTVPNFDGMGDIDEKAIARYDCERMLYIINQAIAIYGENRSLGNVADNIRAKLKEMNK